MQSSVLEQPLVIDPRVRRGATQRRRLMLAAGLLVLAGIAAFFLLRTRPEPVRYGTALTERRTITRAVEATGSLDVLRRVEVPARTAGQLVSVLVRIGERVTEGQALGVLDGRASAIASRATQASVDASSGRVAEAQAALATASEARQRSTKLRSRELASDVDVEAAVGREAKARAALATARAERTQALEHLRSAKLAESFSVITAPIAGVVLEAPESSGGTVAPERGTLFVLGSSLAVLRVRADVAESDVSELKPGQRATFSVPAHAGRAFDAVVEHVGVDARRTAVAVRYPVELRAENPSGLLLPGMTATVEIVVARADNVLAARDAVLRFQPEGVPDAPPRSRVWRVTPRGVEAIRVTAGISDGAFTELRAEPPEALGLGVELALSLAPSDEAKANGPGIRLGNR